VPAILPQLDAFVYSTDHDTFGIAVIEAIASGIPVFVNDRKVMQEITKNGQFATLYKTKDEKDLLDRFLHFLADKERISGQARQHASQIREIYSIQNHLRRLDEVYRSLITN
jgi:glycosyltransferase involved in cell wall biosynthesis